MAWVNNNKKNARFNPNRRDDRLMMSQVTSRREHKKQREVEPEIELVSTDPSHVLSMGGETRLDWLQMGLMQASMGKLKVDSLYKVLTNPAFGPSESSARKPLKALVLANLHLFSPKQQKAIKEAVSSWSRHSGGGGGGGDDEDRGGDGDRDDRHRGGGGDRGRDGSASPAGPTRGSPSGSERRRRKRSKSRKRRDPSRSRQRSRSREQQRERSRSRSRSRSRGARKRR